MTLNDVFVNWKDIDLDELLGEFTDDDDFYSDNARSVSTSESEIGSSIAQEETVDVAVTKGMDCVFFSFE